MSPVRIRLARFGTRHLPFYRIFVADSRSPRDGKHIEVVGTYDPIPGKDGNKHVSIDFDRMAYWLGVGAQPTQTVRRILGAFIPQKADIHSLPRKRSSSYCLQILISEVNPQIFYFSFPEMFSLLVTGQSGILPLVPSMAGSRAIRNEQKGQKK